MTPSRALRLPILALLLAAAAVGARAEDAVDTVDYEIRGKDRVLGTLRPENERESFYVRALRGTRVTATVRRLGRISLVPALELVDDGLASLASGTATRTGARLRGFTFADTAPVRFRVTGTGGDGDYRLDLALRPQTVWRERSSEDQAPGPGGDLLVAFAAPAGSTAIVDFRAAGRSAHRPQVVELVPPAGDPAVVDPPRDGSRRHHAVLTIAKSGENQLRLRNVGDAQGGWSLTVRLRGAVPPRATTDLTDDALAGEFAGLQAVVARLAVPGETTVLDPLDGLNLDGVTMSVPGGAVSFPTVISMYESEPFFVEDGVYDAGTALSFAPSGTEFGENLTVTVPYDPDAFDPGTADDPEDGILVAIQDPVTGEITYVSPTSVDTVNYECEFPVGHFSLAQPTSRQPRPLRGDFTELELGAAALPGWGAAVTYGRNGLLLAERQGTRATGAGARTLRRTTVGWQLDAQGTPRLLAQNDVRTGLPVTAKVLDDANVQLDPDSQDPDVGTVLRRGRGGDLLGAVETLPIGIGARLHLMVRKTRGFATAATLAGGWHLRVLEVRAGATNGPDLDVAITALEADLDVDPKGRALPSAVVARQMTQLFPSRPWVERKSAPRLVAGGLAAGVLASPTLDLDLGPLFHGDLPSAVPLQPLLGGELFVGSVNLVDGSAAPEFAAFRVVMLVRRASKATAALLPQNSLLSTLRLQPEAVSSAPFPLAVLGRDGRLDVSGALFRFVGTQASVTHDSRGDPVLDAEPGSVASSATVRPDGRVLFKSGLPQGIVTPSGKALVVFDAGAGGIEFGQAYPAPPPPIAK